MKNLLIILSVYSIIAATTLQTGCRAKNEQPKVVKNIEVAAMEIAIDETDSSDYTILKQKLDNLGKTIENEQISQVITLRLGEGGQSVWATNFQVFKLPLLLTKNFDENIAENNIEQSCRTRLRCRQERMQKMREDFESSKAEKNITALAKRQLNTNQIVDSLLVPPKDMAKCSDINEFRDRLISDNYKRVILFSDGFHDCPTPITVKTFAPDVKVLVLILPLLNEHSGPSFSERKNILQKIFNGEGVEIMPAASATTETFSKFLDQSL